MASTAFQKSTIVRVQQRALTTVFGVAERVSSQLGGRLAAHIWFTLPPVPREHQQPADGSPFTVTSQGSTVQGTSWGTGPTVYLVHGWGGRGSQLTAFVDPLVRAGHQVVAFDAPSHGRSGPGPSGAGRSTALELGRALDAVAARFGPARAVVAHSLGAMATLLAVRDGWLGVDRLILVAPILDVDDVLDVFTTSLAIGPRTRARLGDRIARRTDVSLSDLSSAALTADLPPTLVLHDRSDRQAPYTASEVLDARNRNVTLVGTSGLGHQRILRDPSLVSAAVRYVAAGSTSEFEANGAVAS